MHVQTENEFRSKLLELTVADSLWPDVLIFPGFQATDEPEIPPEEPALLKLTERRRRKAKENAVQKKQKNRSTTTEESNAANAQQLRRGMRTRTGLTPRLSDAYMSDKAQIFPEQRDSFRQVPLPDGLRNIQSKVDNHVVPTGQAAMLSRAVILKDRKNAQRLECPIEDEAAWLSVQPTPPIYEAAAQMRTEREKELLAYALGVQPEVKVAVSKERQKTPKRKPSPLAAKPVEQGRVKADVSKQFKQMTFLPNFAPFAPDADDRRDTPVSLRRSEEMNEKHRHCNRTSRSGRKY